MNDFAKRFSKRAVSRPNANRAFNRIKSELNTLIRNARDGDTVERATSLNAVNAFLDALYLKHWHADEQKK